MRICLVGKFPPIQGGVSMHTYRYAHALARCGHQVDVVTNASEVKPPYRMFMRGDDWRRCEARYGRGQVSVHWTEAADGRQFHIPMSSAFVTKLAALGIAAGQARRFDVVFSYYAEPYAVAGHLIAQALDIPHVIRTAGSDAGRLWQQPQFGPLYSHVFKSADAMVVGGVVARRLRAIGVPSERIHADAQSSLPFDLFAGTSPMLDLRALRAATAGDEDFAPLYRGDWRPDLTYVGVYGKLGETKGTYALLRALARANGEGRNIGLLVMGHARPRNDRDAIAYATELGLADRVVQIPFLPHWRVPEFIRRCVAICCLEQGFPIAIHRPIVASEVLASGACLIASTELLGKLPTPERLVSGYNCLAVRDVNDEGALAEALVAATVAPKRAAAIGRRGQKLAGEWASENAFPQAIEDVLQSVIAPKPATQRPTVSAALLQPRFPLIWQALGRMPRRLRTRLTSGVKGRPDGLAWAQAIARLLDGPVWSGDESATELREAVRLDVILDMASATAENHSEGSKRLDDFFRFGPSEFPARAESWGPFIPSRRSNIRLERFERDLNQMIPARWSAGRSAAFSPRMNYLALVRPGHNDMRALVLQQEAGELLIRCDGKINVRELAVRHWPRGRFAQLVGCLEMLLQQGLIEISDGSLPQT